MKLPRRRFLQLTGAAAAAPALVRLSALDYPTRPIGWIVEYPLGARADAVMRSIARAHALGSLAPQLSPVQIDDALADAKAIGDERYRAHALGLLAPQLSPNQIADALSAARAIGDKRYRAHALGLLAPNRKMRSSAAERARRRGNCGGVDHARSVTLRVTCVATKDAGVARPACVE
jgi:hypothetical protein